MLNKARDNSTVNVKISYFTLVLCLFAGSHLKHSQRYNKSPEASNFLFALPSDEAGTCARTLLDFLQRHIFTVSVRSSLLNLVLSRLPITHIYIVLWQATGSKNGYPALTTFGHSPRPAD